MYWSPSSTEQNNFKVFNHLQKIPEYDNAHTVMVGGFNYPEIDWTAWSTIKSEEHHSQKLIDACRAAYLHHHKIQSTRHRHGQNERQAWMKYKQTKSEADYLTATQLKDDYD